MLGLVRVNSGGTPQSLISCNNTEAAVGGGRSLHEWQHNNSRSIYGPEQAPSSFNRYCLEALVLLISTPVQEHGISHLNLIFHGDEWPQRSDCKGIIITSSSSSSSSSVLISAHAFHQTKFLLISENNAAHADCSCDSSRENKIWGAE